MRLEEREPDKETDIATLQTSWQVEEWGGGVVLIPF